MNYPPVSNYPISKLLQRIIFSHRIECKHCLPVHQSAYRFHHSIQSALLCLRFVLLLLPLLTLEHGLVLMSAALDKFATIDFTFWSMDSVEVSAFPTRSFLVPELSPRPLSLITVSINLFQSSLAFSRVLSCAMSSTLFTSSPLSLVVERPGLHFLASADNYSALHRQKFSPPTVTAILTFGTVLLKTNSN